MKNFFYIVTILLGFQLFIPVNAILTDVKELHPESLKYCAQRDGQEDSTPEIKQIVCESLKKFGVKNAELFPVKRMSKEADERNGKSTLAFANSWGIWIHPAFENLENYPLSKEEAEIYRNQVIQHETIHAYEPHAKRQSALRNKFDAFSFVTTPLTTAGTFMIAKTYDCSLETSIATGLVSGIGYLFGMLAVRSHTEKLQTKLIEMEADLGAVHLGAFDNKIVVDLTKPDLDDGKHPTPRETLYYAKEFLDERKAGKNPSYKKLAWKYLWEREIFKSIWQKKID